MTSQVTREDLSSELYLAGVRDPRKLERALRAIEAHVQSRLRNAVVRPPVKEELPPSRPGPELKKKDSHKAEYLCRNCRGYFPLDFFPEAKRVNPSASVDCLACGGAAQEKLYKCTGSGMCNQPKPLGDFPERKRNDPSLKTPCSYCDSRRVTVRDAR